MWVLGKPRARNRPKTARIRRVWKHDFLSQNTAPRVFVRESRDRPQNVGIGLGFQKNILKKFLVRWGGQKYPKTKWLFFDPVLYPGFFFDKSQKKPIFFFLREILNFGPIWMRPGPFERAVDSAYRSCRSFSDPKNHRNEKPD